MSSGPVTNFPVGETRLETFANPISQPWDGMTAKTGVYVRNLGDDKFLVFAINCTHLGCPVTWFPQSGLFMCPVPWRRLLRERRARLGTAAARTVSLRLACRERAELEIQAPHLPTLQDTLTRRTLRATNLAEA